MFEIIIVVLTISILSQLIQILSAVNLDHIKTVFLRKFTDKLRQKVDFQDFNKKIINILFTKPKPPAQTTKILQPDSQASTSNTPNQAYEDLQTTESSEKSSVIIVDDLQDSFSQNSISTAEPLTTNPNPTTQDQPPLAQIEATNWLKQRSPKTSSKKSTQKKVMLSYITLTKTRRKIKENKRKNGGSLDFTKPNGSNAIYKVGALELKIYQSRRMFGYSCLKPVYETKEEMIYDQLMNSLPFSFR